MSILIIIGIIFVGFVVWFVYHQRRLRLRAHLMQEAIRNRDFTFRMPTHGLLPGERAMQETLNQLGDTIRQQVNQNEVESWERLTRVLTHEMMNATAPITSISQSMLSRHLSDFVVNYRKMSELEKPLLTDVRLLAVIDEISKAYPQLTWEVSVPADLVVRADIGMLRQVLMNLVKNAIEANATKMVVEETDSTAEANWLSPSGRRAKPSSLFTHHFSLYVGNDGLPIPAENRQSLFVPFFTTKRSGSGIGLSLSRRMMIQQGGMLDLAETPLQGCHAAFILSLQV